MARVLRLIHFSVWADRLEDVETYLGRVSTIDLRPRVADPSNQELLRTARLDCDWYAESTRAFAAMQHSNLEFKSAWVCGPAGLVDLISAPREADEQRWLVFDGQTPGKLARVAGQLLQLLHRSGIKIAWYAFDEASRTCGTFREVAPYLSILIHDEHPLDPEGQARLGADCLALNRSWVANTIPFTAAFNETPEERIVFLGSKFGLTDHRRRQLAFLKKSFRDRFVAIHDHSVPVAERNSLNRFKVSVCPEGRKFTTPAMSRSHTDRPFWSGCLGLVPVSEDSREGGRLENLAHERYLLRYDHGDLASLRTRCDEALGLGTAERRRIYDYFNRHETVGTVLADALHVACTRAV